MPIAFAISKAEIGRAPVVLSIDSDAKMIEIHCGTDSFSEKSAASGATKLKIDGRAADPLMLVRRTDQVVIVRAPRMADEVHQGLVHTGGLLAGGMKSEDGGRFVVLQGVQDFGSAPLYCLEEGVLRIGPMTLWPVIGRGRSVRVVRHGVTR